jgi:acetolactate synthase-1/2/3 large subunit
MRTGALSLVETAVRAGVQACFANPGTTEMPIVATVDQVPELRVVLGLFEGVCAGAADGWARMTGRPAATLLHLGPGFANGLAHLHNARRAHTPVVSWVGEHATRHRAFDAPLTSDIAALTGSVGWTRTIESPQETAEASRAAVEAAMGPPGRVASLIIPADCQWEPGPEPLEPRPLPGRHEASTSAVREAARLLRTDGGGILLGGDALSEKGLRAAARVTAATGADAWTETFPSRHERGCGVPAFPALPYFPNHAREALGSVSSLVLAGARDPVAFFACPDQPARLAPEGATVHVLANPDAGVAATPALEALAAELGAPGAAAETPPRVLAFAPKNQPLDADSLGRAVSAFTPEGAIVVNEAATTGLLWSAAYAAGAAPHTVLGLTGGAIGTGLPLALGAALACPDRRVIAFQADGSGLYAPQALWSMAREAADVTVVVCANRCYRILQIELVRAMRGEPGPEAEALTELARPTMDWAALAKGFGVPACTVSTDTELGDALRHSLAEPGPTLIEAVLVADRT